jgi:PLP dependent protein
LRISPLIAAPMSEVEQAIVRLEAIQNAVARALQIAHRPANAATLIAISKTQSTDAIAALIAAGQRVFGENRVQEAQSKWPDLRATTPDIELHLVGQLQSNKAEEAVETFDVVHSVDRPSLASALLKAEAKRGLKRRYFLQVNIGDELQKGGCAVSELPALLQATAGLNVLGLMAVPPLGHEAAPYFALLAKLARDHNLPALSMGMSGDFETALMLGATHIRVGTALFGARA